MNRRKFSATAMAGGIGLFAALFGGRKAAAHVLVPPTTPDTWRPRRRPSLLAPGATDARKVAQIWESYGLALPNHYDAVETFCNAILSDWTRNRSAYVWRYASTQGHQVYVLPTRFVLRHPPFLPDFPRGYYRLGPGCEAGDAVSCIHPNAFFRILSVESVDEYAPGEVVPTLG